ncbi:MAG: tRNA (adenosine(37)-N6)-dimethylallyltransferase MiaA [Rikenellaceae bacterium]|jgi:tRNA dimethylallyltransferase|nr:tRNA (adenosine(37)-N6)-dimethylallyltransferase MiaA [Rikenellaceae bacterium]
MITLLGPTASGKTALAVRIAARSGMEIVSADSRQVYRGMDIGTGKDIAEYRFDGKLVPVHLLDIHDAGYKYSLFEYQQDFFTAYRRLVSEGKGVLLCGGSGLYIEAVTGGYELYPVPPDEALRAELEGFSLKELSEKLAAMKRLHNRTDLDNKKRVIRAIEIETFIEKHPEAAVPDFPSIENLCLGIDVPREVRRERITRRLHARLEGGLVEEVRGLLDRGIAPEDLAYYGLEYKYLTLCLTGRLSYEKMVRELEIAIHRFGKRQMTWFRGMERRGTRIHWIDGTQSVETQLDEALRIIAQNR